MSRLLNRARSAVSALPTLANALRSTTLEAPGTVPERESERVELRCRLWWIKQRLGGSGANPAARVSTRAEHPPKGELLLHRPEREAGRDGC
jgi:hypothetical protein